MSFANVIVGKITDLVSTSVEKNAYLATIPSHNSQDAIDCAKIVALIIFYARNGHTKSEIINKLNISPNVTRTVPSKSLKSSAHIITA